MADTPAAPPMPIRVHQTWCAWPEFACNCNSATQEQVVQDNKRLTEELATVREQLRASTERYTAAQVACVEYGLEGLAEGGAGADVAAAIHLLGQQLLPADALVTFHYQNHRGERGLRHVRPTQLWYGSTPFHTEEQWFVKAYDIDKEAERDFAIAAIWGDTVETTLRRLRAEVTRLRKKCGEDQAVEPPTATLPGAPTFEEDTEPCEHGHFALTCAACIAEALTTVQSAERTSPPPERACTCGKPSSWHLGRGGLGTCHGADFDTPNGGYVAESSE